MITSVCKFFAQKSQKIIEFSGRISQVSQVDIKSHENKKLDTDHLISDYNSRNDWNGSTY